MATLRVTPKPAVAIMKAAQVAKPGADTRPITSPVHRFTSNWLLANNEDVSLFSRLSQRLSRIPERYLVSGFENQFLHTPVQYFSDIEFILRWTSDLVNPPELP